MKRFFVLVLAIAAIAASCTKEKGQGSVRVVEPQFFYAVKDTVKSGYTTWDRAKVFYGSGLKWVDIVAQNKFLQEPGRVWKDSVDGRWYVLIFPGEVLQIGKTFVSPKFEEKIVEKEKDHTFWWWLLTLLLVFATAIIGGALLLQRRQRRINSSSAPGATQTPTPPVTATAPRTSPVTVIPVVSAPTQDQPPVKPEGPEAPTTSEHELFVVGTRHQDSTDKFIEKGQVFKVTSTFENSAGKVTTVWEANKNLPAPETKK